MCVCVLQRMEVILRSAAAEKSQVHHSRGLSYLICQPEQPLPDKLWRNASGPGHELPGSLGPTAVLVWAECVDVGRKGGWRGKEGGYPKPCNQLYTQQRWSSDAQTCSSWTVIVQSRILLQSFSSKEQRGTRVP